MTPSQRQAYYKKLLKGILWLIKINDLDITIEELLFISDTKRMQKKYRAIFWNTKNKEPIYKSFHSLSHLINYFKKQYNLSEEDILSQV